jgi:hypothetical protein
MARSLGPRLPAALVERLSQRDLTARLGVALPFVTVDREGRPHAMLVSYLELRAYDSGTLGLVIQARSASARNLAERQAGTLMILEPDTVVYVKTRAVDGPLDVAGDEGLGLGYFLLGVEDVLEDTAAEWEGGMRITGTRRGVGPRDARRAGGAARPRLTHSPFGESFGVSFGFAGASRSRETSRSL